MATVCTERLALSHLTSNNVNEEDEEEEVGKHVISTAIKGLNKTLYYLCGLTRKEKKKTDLLTCVLESFRVSVFFFS